MANYRAKLQQRQADDEAEMQQRQVAEEEAEYRAQMDLLMDERELFPAEHQQQKTPDETVAELSNVQVGEKL